MLPAMPRPHHEHLHTPELPWSAPPWQGWPQGARVKVLSHDAATGAASVLVGLPAGVALPAGTMASERELLVLDGALDDGGELRGALWWEWAAAGAASGALVARQDTRLLLFARTGPPDLLPGGDPAAPREAVDTATTPWAENPVEDGPPSCRVKLLRTDPATGGIHAIVEDGVEPYSVFEFHDCVEEVYLIAGDLTLENSGEMRPDSYFWRPPYITHGMSSSRQGSLYYVYTDSTLVNHRTDAMTRTPEENRAQAARAASG